MNCLIFRRDVLVDPRAASGDVREHARECAACADFRSRTAALDAKIAEVLAVPVPAGLEERVLAASRGARSRPRRQFLALAASLAGIAVVGGGTFFALRDDPMALAGIDFVVEEEANAILNAKPANPGDLVQVARSLSLELPRQLGEVRYIGICPFQGTIAHHVIVTTPQGKATLLLLPERPVASRGSASARGLRSIVKPAGAGSVAVISESSRSIERIESMAWRT